MASGSGLQASAIHPGRVSDDADKSRGPKSGASSPFPSLRFLPLVLLLAATACQSEPKTVSREIIVWKPVNKWAGRTNVQTESFTGESGSFQVHWESKPFRESPSATLTITLHSAVSGRPLALVVEQQGAGKDITVVGEDPREFFFVIEASGTEWTVELDEGLRAVKQEPVAD